MIAWDVRGTHGYYHKGAEMEPDALGLGLLFPSLGEGSETFETPFSGLSQLA